MRHIYCHPLFDERKWAHRFPYQLKETFQAGGLMLERFDYRGTGEAEGEFENVTMNSLREDIDHCVNSETTSLIGLRFGASLAFDYCIRCMGVIKNLVLIEPILDGTEYVDYLYRKQHIKNIMTGKSFDELPDKGYENIEGYKTSINLLEQIKGFSLVELAERYMMNNSVFIVQISHRQKPDPKLVCLAELLNSKARHVSLENMKLPMFWERIQKPDYSKLTQKVWEWCRG